MADKPTPPSPDHVSMIFDRLAGPLPPEEIKWRQMDKPFERSGQWFARYIAYIEAGYIRRLLDEVALGKWHIAVKALPPLAGSAEPCAVEATIVIDLDDEGIREVRRSGIGQGKDWKQAETDAFKRAAVRFGVAHELYEMGPTIVPMSGGDKWAKPLEDPRIVASRKSANPLGVSRGADESTAARRTTASSAAQPIDVTAPLNSPAEERACPKCGGRTWDNRVGKRNPRAPDFKCRDRGCDGVIWPPKPGEQADLPPARPIEQVVQEVEEESGDLPF